MKIKRVVEKVEVEMFKVGDEVFETREEADKYIQETKGKLHRTYYVVSVHPDLNEGRGHNKKVILSVPNIYSENTAYEFLLKEYGTPLSFVRDITPIATYVLSEPYTFDNLDDLNEFLNTEYEVGIAHPRKKEKLKLINVGEDRRQNLS